MNCDDIWVASEDDRLLATLEAILLANSAVNWLAAWDDMLSLKPLWNCRSIWLANCGDICDTNCAAMVLASCEDTLPAIEDDNWLIICPFIADCARFDAI